jgi:peptidoglycan/LPS O-acetylase OafA/YrhL
MGAFRFLLAATVMLGHYFPVYPQPLPFVMYGTASVPAFYIVSGFLITLVLEERYGGRIGLFYSNRALRIFPLYWAALALFLLVNFLVAGGHLPQSPAYHSTSALWWTQQHGGQVGIIGTMMLALLNIFILGQDLIIYIGQWPHVASRDFFYHGFMYVGPAWTVAVEFAFYAVAPFVVRRPRWTAAVLVASLSARVIAIACGYTEFIDSYGFAPFEMAFFMGGSLAYRAYVRLRAMNAAPVTAYAVISSVAMLLLTVFYLRLPYARPLYLIAVCLCLPGIVLAGRWNPADGILGELSYPVYLLHPLLSITVIPGSTRLPEVGAVVSVLALSFALVFLVERPLEKLRRRRAQAPPMDVPCIPAAQQA